MATTPDCSAERPLLPQKPADWAAEGAVAEHAGEARAIPARRAIEGAAIGAGLAALAGGIVAVAQAVMGLPEIAALVAAVASAALAAEVGVAWAQARAEPQPAAAAAPPPPDIRCDPPVAPAGPSISAPSLARLAEPDPPVAGVDAWRRAAVRAVRADGPDLSMRQAALLLTVYAADRPKTVSELADELGVAKPVISRAVDTLAGVGFLERRRDAEDRRKVFVDRTDAGAAYLRVQAELFDAAHSEAAAPAAV